MVWFGLVWLGLACFGLKIRNSILSFDINKSYSEFTTKSTFKFISPKRFQRQESFPSFLLLNNNVRILCEGARLFPSGQLLKSSWDRTTKPKKKRKANKRKKESNEKKTIETGIKEQTQLDGPTTKAHPTNLWQNDWNSRLYLFSGSTICQKLGFTLIWFQPLKRKPSFQTIKIRAEYLMLLLYQY